MENEQSNNNQQPYAGFGKRMAAMLIDRVIISMASFYVYSEIRREAIRMVKKNEGFFKKLLNNTDESSLTFQYDAADHITYYALSFFFAIVLWCYYAGMESSPWKGTIGKKLVGLEVTDINGNRISFTKASGRYFGKIISIIVFGFGYLAMLFNNKKQTWHDSMSGCVVKEK